MSDRLAMIEQMIAKGSTDPFHHYARAMELRSLGRLEDALAAYADVRERFVDYVPTYLMAAQVALELDRDEDARAWAEQGIVQAKAKHDDHAARELDGFLMAL
ncbi:MAG: tetratricopeptide repeat protein [Sandaracinaceae bacterium]|nr:MAG: tetratricopeptide repeat protein [Sandaracinaceae bacterium]HBQ14246.1 tetratricopeptide repeat-containing protein [Myxococcales bacterium]